MNIQFLRSFLLWCAVFNYVLLILWWVLITLAHDFSYRFSSRLIPMSVERFDSLHYAGIIFYKILTILLFVIPCIVLWCIG